MIKQRPGEGMSIYLRWIGLSESSETNCFQFRALTEMIRLILPFWCSFASPDDVSEQGDDFVGSPRALYGA